jgi:uncharacterized surface protein with fasciclin (FAS1) repeats
MKLNRRSLMTLAAAGAGSALLAACGGGSDDDEAPTSGPGNLVEVAQGNALFTTLVAAVVKAELAGALSGSEPLTVFAPTNAAFDAVAQAIGLEDGPALVDALPADALAKILTYHVVAGRNLASGLTAGSLSTLYTFDDAPATLALSLDSGVTLTDAVLTTATVITPDVAASNGVIHVINKVLVPPGVLNIVQMAQLNTGFSSLVGAVVTAGLADTLSAANATLTVFAPVNSAFEAIGSTVATLTTEQLGTVLTYHVLDSQVLSSQLGPVFGMPVTTLANQDITINNNATPPAIATITDTTMEAANIVAVDVRASNGVIHVIDKVLLPSLPPA